ncbi:hypothetical protein APHAL10511_004056 [Amanita phalloides]|nr:hypothetical protein APHAL10511_004056 [Amanita phalloides]
MHEILYIQAGSFANYIGTHFWNTQETYLSFEDPDNPNIQHDVSLKEIPGQATYCPRVLLFDRKANFGPLTKTNALGVKAVEGTIEDSLWTGNVHQHNQTAIRRSKYHLRLEETCGLGVEPNDDEHAYLLQDSHEIRYWSDFSRVYYSPKSIQPVPNPMCGEQERDDWVGGSELFSRYNEDTSLMEDSVRLFLEECDHFQGLHVVSDVDTFGGFTSAFLTTFRDEFSRASSLVVPILSCSSFHFAGTPDARASRAVVNDAYYLRSLSEFASMSVPILSPTAWPLDSKSHLVNFDKNSIHQTSAIISTHLESSTLPLRLYKSRITVPDYCAQATRYGAGPFCQLNGRVPVAISTAFDAQFNFSAADTECDVEEWNRVDVTRGFSPALLGKYDEWHQAANGRGTLVSSTHAFAYPLPSSYPAIFQDTDLVVSPYNGKNVPPAISVLSSISNNNGMAKTFSAYAGYIQNMLRLGLPSVGSETDELRELINDLWTLHDCYPGDQSYANDEEID